MKTHPVTVSHRVSEVSESKKAPLKSEMLLMYALSAIIFERITLQNPYTRSIHKLLPNNPFRCRTKR